MIVPVVARSWAAHITGLLREVRPDLDAETTTALLMAPLGSEIVVRAVQTVGRERVRESMRAPVASVLAAG